MKKASRFLFLAFPAVALLCLLRPPIFIAEMIQSLSLQVSFLFLVVGLALLVRNRIRSGLSASLSGAAMALSLLPWLLPQPAQPTGTSPDLRVAHFNVLYQNSDHLPLIQQALDTNADFISFQEVTPTWAAELDTHLHAEYPYSLVVPHKKGQGIAIYSRLPLENMEVKWYEYVPALRGSICIKGQPVQFITAHTTTPTLPKRYKLRNHQLADMAAISADTQGPSLLVGDLNTVPWSPALVQLLEVGQLHDSREGLSATFPSWFSPGRIPIDYILHSGDLQCLGFRTLENSGSDHLGIVSEFALIGHSQDVVSLSEESTPITEWRLTLQ